MPELQKGDVTGLTGKDAALAMRENADDVGGNPYGQGIIGG